MRYRIECLIERDGNLQRFDVAMVFRDKAAALGSACVLMDTGIAVSKVSGPNFEMSKTAVEAYYRASRRRERAG